MREFFWRLIARIVTRPAVVDWLIRRAARTPYLHLTNPDGSVYMGRWWLFNPYPGKGDERKMLPWLPSIRVHHIMRADQDRHLHDHPWNARTIVLRGYYDEQRYGEPGVYADGSHDQLRPYYDEAIDVFQRERGYTGRVLFNQFHRISEVSDGGVWTLWFTWKYRGTWGFDVDGRKVPYREYLGIDT